MLAHAHDALDVAVAAAYGWSAEVSDEGGVRELLARKAGSGCAALVPRKRSAGIPATERSSRDAHDCVRRFATSPWD